MNHNPLSRTLEDHYTTKPKQKHVLVYELEKLINPASPQILKYSSEARTLLVGFTSYQASFFEKYVKNYRCFGFELEYQK